MPEARHCQQLVDSEVIGQSFDTGVHSGARDGAVSSYPLCQVEISRGLSSGAQHAVLE